ncbi:unnamed protein product [Boreogadus saida]
MSRKKLAWANKEVETFVCILGEEDVVYDVYVDAAAIDIRPTTKGTVGSGNATSELSWANRSLPTASLRSDPFRTLQWKCGIRVPFSKVVSTQTLVALLDPGVFLNPSLLSWELRTLWFRHGKFDAGVQTPKDGRPGGRSSVILHLEQQPTTPGYTGANGNSLLEWAGSKSQ